MDDKNREEGRFSSVDTAVQVLDVIETRDYIVSLEDIGKQLGIGRTTAYRAVKLLRAQDAIKVVLMGTGATPTVYGPA